MPFLPLTTEEMRERGWDAPDAVVVTGDAYVDHPSFGAAITSRVLEAEGLQVCMLSQPESAADSPVSAGPCLGFFIGGGNIDSMVAHYTAAKRRRSDDAYTPGGRAGARPDRGGARLLQAGEGRLSRCPADHRRPGSVPAPLRPLRLLG